MIPYGMFQCMNRLCKKVYKHQSDQSYSAWNDSGNDVGPGNGYFMGYTMPHTCPFCDSIYVEWIDFEKQWECNESTDWKYTRKLLDKE